MRKKKRNRKRILPKSIDDEISLVCSKDSDSQTIDTKITAVGAYCPIVNMYCKIDDCETCSILKNEIPNHKWVCSSCMDDSKYVSHPFWGDTPCEDCGTTFGVMICVKKRKIRR